MSFRTDFGVVVVLNNVRSLYNTGAILRTADGAGVDRVILCGITPRPDQGVKQRRAIGKTALGAEDTVSWTHEWDTSVALNQLREAGYLIVAVETGANAVDLFEWTPTWPICLVFGHEREGISPQLARRIDLTVCIPMVGHKRSLNVATAAGVVLYDLLRRRRDHGSPQPSRSMRLDDSPCTGGTTSGTT